MAPIARGFAAVPPFVAEVLDGLGEHAASGSNNKPDNNICLIPDLDIILTAYLKSMLEATPTENGV